MPRAPLQNRVLPTGEITADPARGLLTGNRGILHDGKTLGARRWTHPHWISCTLDWKGTRRVPMSPGTWTELFFLDEAVALAAGHRPCALCRREAFGRFQAAWTVAHGPARAGEIDRRLHPARVARDRRQVRHEAEAGSLPAGAFALIGGAAHLLTARGARPFSTAGYGAEAARPRGLVPVLSPVPIVAVLDAGYVPLLHPTAD